MSALGGKPPSRMGEYFRFSQVFLKFPHIFPNAAPPEARIDRGPVTGPGFYLQPPVAQSGGQDMRSAFDFAPFRRSTVGFDRLFDMLENSNTGQAQENYPPFDLIKLGDNELSDRARSRRLQG